MKTTTMLAIAAAIVGVIAILYFATRSRTPTPVMAGAGAEGADGPNANARAVTAFGTGLTGIVAGIAEIA